MSYPLPPNRQTELKSILRERQLSRIRRACLPCRERKVRCNHQVPCQTCVKRGHSDLCSYDRTSNLGCSPYVTKRAETHPESGPAADSGLAIKRGTFTETPTDFNPEASTSATALLGRNSIIGVGQATTDPPWPDTERRTAFESGVVPLLGASTISDTRIGSEPTQLKSSLRYDEDAITLFSFYRDRIHPFNFIVDDLVEMEGLMCSLVDGDVQAQRVDNHTLCLLHAIFAAGAQFSDFIAPVRISKCRKERE